MHVFYVPTGTNQAWLSTFRTSCNLWVQLFASCVWDSTEETFLFWLFGLFQRLFLLFSFLSVAFYIPALGFMPSFQTPRKNDYSKLFFVKWSCLVFFCFIYNKVIEIFYHIFPWLSQLGKKNSLILCEILEFHPRFFSFKNFLWIFKMVKIKEKYGKNIKSNESL